MITSDCGVDRQLDATRSDADCVAATCSNKDRLVCCKPSSSAATPDNTRPVIPKPDGGGGAGGAGGADAATGSTALTDGTLVLPTKKKMSGGSSLRSVAYAAALGVGGGALLVAVHLADFMSA